jgi:ATP-dependent helicase/nuclease subunit B
MRAGVEWYPSGMNTRAVISAATWRRIEPARRWLAARDVAEEVLIVGSSLDAANELARDLVEKRGAAFGWHRLTLPQLAAAVAAPALAVRGLVPLSRAGTEAIVARLVHRLAASGRLSRYDAIAGTPGFPRAVAGVIGELRLGRLPADCVAAVAPDLALLMGAYEAELAEARLTDWPGVLALAAEAAGDGGARRHRFVGLPLLLLDVPLGSEAELAFVEAIAAAAPDLLATVPATDEPTLRRLRDGLGVAVSDLDATPSGGSGGGGGLGALANLQRNLFNERAGVSGAGGDGGVGVFSAPGEGREATEIARRILALAREGIPFDRIAVLLRAPEAYRTHLEEAFSRAGIPVHFARGAVRPDPAGRAFYALLKCAAEGLSARRFAEYLSLGQVPDAVASGAPPEAAPRGDRWVAPGLELIPLVAAEEAGEEVRPEEGGGAGADGGPVVDGQLRAPRRWEQLLVEAAVIGGRERWRRRIDGLANELRRRRDEISEEDESRAAALERAIEDLAALAGYALPLIDSLDALPKAASWGEWLDQLGALATRALKEPERVLSVLAELAPMAPVGPVGLNEVLLVLERSFLEVAVAPASQRYGKVFVGPVEAARGMSFTSVFVPGLAERVFPRKIVEEPILLDSVRKQIDGVLVTNQDRLEAERLALALAVGAAEQHICFSYPRLDLEQGRPRVPSFYALEAVRASEGRLPDFGELARRAETATTARLGWPAPPDPAEAIDNAEYDLAILARLVADPEKSAGAGRYLVKANRHLGRALRFRYQRWGRSWTVADGLMTRSEAARAIMGHHALAARPYSATGLQDYATCPYRFFLRAVQGLSPRDVPEAIDTLDPLQRGSLIHDVQFALLARLRDLGLLPVRPGTLERARRELDAILAEVAARYRDELAPAIDRVWGDGISAVHADLREWLRRASEDDSGYVPREFELAFGVEARAGRNVDPASVPEPVELACGIQLRGSIDVVEHHASGLARVTDEKTGKYAGTKGQITAGGTVLQPLLYPLAAEKLLGAKLKVESGRLYFCTSAGGFAELIVPLDERGREAANQLAQTIGEALNIPFLPAAPAQGECAFCDYRPVCGPHEERRVLRKKQALEALLALREMP